MTLTDDAKAVIALTTRLGDQGRPALSPGDWHRTAASLAAAGLTPADLFRNDLPGGERDHSVLPPDLADDVAARMASASVATVAAGELGRRGIWAVTIVEDAYPTAFDLLGAAAPPVLFGAGDQTIMRRGGVAVVGSRTVSHPGERFAEAVAARAAELGRPVVSGAARGVDQLALYAAYRVEGAVVGVLADSLETRIRNPDMLQALDRGDVCLVTQQSPATGFSVGAALARNKLIYALAEVTVVVAADLGTGGTWAGAVEALQHGYGPVAVWRGVGVGAGNAGLEGEGATPIRSADGLESLITAPERPSESEALGQLSILDSGDE
jgi:predicted Rossmann fold nucleotide-binding protein DprA/Smf involved in DNA uptake